MSTKEPLTRPRLRTPRAAAIAGIVFSVLLGAAIILARLSVPPAQADSGLLTSPHDRTTTAIALNLVPFAGIAFLWFIGVVRDRVGQHEDRFFASVFLGSGLLFVAMLFVASAVASAVILDSAVRLSPAAWALGRRVSYGLLNVYAMRMAAVFAISTATIAMRTKIIPRWLGITGYTVGAVLLVAVDALPWLELAFPLWTLLLSVRILIAGLQAPGDQARLAGQLDLARPPAPLSPDISPRWRGYNAGTKVMTRGNIGQHAHRASRARRTAIAALRTCPAYPVQAPAPGAAAGSGTPAPPARRTEVGEEPSAHAGLRPSRLRQDHAACPVDRRRR